MTLAAHEVRVAAGENHAVAVERKVVVDKELGIAAEVENVAIAVDMGDGNVGIARQQRIRGVAVQGSGGTTSQAATGIRFQQGGSFQRFSGLGQIKEAQDETPNKGSLFIKLCGILCGSGICLLLMLVVAAVPLAALIIGAIYLPQCEIFNGESNTNIPIWLIVFGTVSLLQTVVNLCKRCCQRILRTKEEDDDDDGATKCISCCGCCIESFLIAFLFVWLIAGSVWVFGAFSEYQVPDAGCVDCCHAVPYLYSFVVLILIYSLGGLFCLVMCCCFCCLALCND